MLVAILILDTFMVNAFSVDVDILNSSLLLASFWQAALWQHYYSSGIETQIAAYK